MYANATFSSSPRPEHSSKHQDRRSSELRDRGCAAVRHIARSLLSEVVGSDVRKLALAGKEGVVGSDIADVGAEGAEVGVMSYVSVTRQVSRSGKRSI